METIREVCYSKADNTSDTTDYLPLYRRFFEEFARTVNPDDQLPVKVAGYYLCDFELVGEIVDWTLQYLNQKECPSSLVAPLTRIVIDEIKTTCKKQPLACGYRQGENVYQPLKLMQVVTGKVNEVCSRYCDNGKLATLPPPSPGPPISSCAIKNSRRLMEDRHVIIEDFNVIFNTQDRNPTSYYAVFDGHAGTDAAMYSVSHLHQFLAESSFYPTDPERALKDAFSRTDAHFLEKSNRENLRSGTTAVCALLRHKEKMLYVAWLGDSQALLVRKGEAVQVVNPHKPDRKDERERIEDMGGCVLFWGTWRVNGQLAVSRAIGDLEYKPYVIAEPDVTAVPLDGTEDFLLLACDGLWDFVTEQEAVEAVYQQVAESPGDTEAVSQRLVQLSKEQGSTDNISVIVVFLTDPVQLSSRPVPPPRPLWASLCNGPQQEASLQTARAMEMSFDNTNNTSKGNNPFLMNPTSNGPESVPFQKGSLLLDFGGGGDDGSGYKKNGSPSTADIYFSDRPANCKNSTDFGSYEDDDFGPETDVDAVDDPLSPAIETMKTADLSNSSNNNPFSSHDFDEVQEERQQDKRTIEADLEIRQQLNDFDPVSKQREETPTPPADEVPVVTSNLVPESDNVAESGEDSEDEWNYYRVEPSVGDRNQEASQPICQKPAELQSEEDPNMESQLNPDAAEFVPSPTQKKPSMEDVLLSQCPKKGVTMENISIPSHSEFQQEISLCPSELDDIASKSPLLPETKLVDNLPDLINTEDRGDIMNSFLPPSDICDNIENGAAFENFLKEQSSKIQELTRTVLDESEVSSTKAEFGDDITIDSEFQSTVLENMSSSSALEKSFGEQDFDGNEFMTELKCDIESTYLSGSVLEKVTEEDIFDPLESTERTIPMSFELQKELVPEMELKPERVQLESDGTSSFEQDESGGSPLQSEDLEKLAITTSDTVSSTVSTKPNLQELISGDLNTLNDRSSSVHGEQFCLEPEAVPSLEAPNAAHYESTAASTPETIPLEKDALSPSPQFETKDLLSDEVLEVLPSKLSPLLEKTQNETLKSADEDSFLQLSQNTKGDSLDFSHLSNKCDYPVPPEHVLDFRSQEDQTNVCEQKVQTHEKLVAELDVLVEQEKSVHEISDNESNKSVINTVEDELNKLASNILPSTTAQVLEEVPQLSTEIDPLLSENQQKTEIQEMTREENSEPVSEGSLTTATVAATAAAAVATAVAVGTVTSSEQKTPTDEKLQEVKALSTEAKKLAPSKDKKGPIADKAKSMKTTTTTTTTKTASGSTLSARTQPKPSAVPPSKTAPPAKKPVTAASNAVSNKTAKPSTTTTSASTKPKTLTSPTKPLPTTTSKTASPRTRPSSATTTVTKSAALSNGNATKSVPLKKSTVPTAAKPLNRPATAPPMTKSPTTKPVASLTSKTTTTAPPRPKPGVANGSVNKARTVGPVATATARSKLSSPRDTKLATEKQVKETANKQISSTRTATSKSTTVTAARSTTIAATRKTAGMTKTTVTTTTTVKTSTGKVAPKKTTSSTSVTASPKTKTAITATENNEVVHVQQVTEAQN